MTPFRGEVLCAYILQNILDLSRMPAVGSSGKLVSCILLNDECHQFIFQLFDSVPPRSCLSRFEVSNCEHSVTVVVVMTLACS